MFCAKAHIVLRMQPGTRSYHGCLGQYFSARNKPLCNSKAAEAKKWVNQAIKQHDCQMTKFFLEQIEDKI